MLELLRPSCAAIASAACRRAGHVGERQRVAVAQRQAEQERYIQEVAGASQGPAEQIASAKALLDSAAVTQAEYESLKAKALA
jgi:hypothetical protein